MPIYLRCQGTKVTASFGVALLKPGEQADSWLARADAAMYQAKQAGRDRVVFSECISPPEAESDTVLQPAG